MKLSFFKVFTACLLFVNTNAYAQFLGGDGGGSTNQFLTNVACSLSNANPFLGGDGSGHSNIRLANTVCTVVNSNPFLGGSGDGQSNISLANIICSVINSNPFLGGDADGHSSITMTNTVCTIVNSNPFLGGEADGHSNMRLECPGIPLPIKLIHFSASPNENMVDLKWATSNEINNDFFTVERSLNGSDWEIVATINGAGNSSSILNYSTVDKTPYLGVSYYRLKQTDFDGRFEYFKSIYVNLNLIATNSIIIFPNPTNHLVTIIGNPKDLLEIKVRNVLGQEVTSSVDIIVKNESKLLMDLSKLSQGIYFIQTTSTTNRVYKN